MAEKKNVFDKAIDALTNRDEKAAAEEAKLATAAAIKQTQEATARANAAEVMNSKPSKLQKQMLH
jgi:hypothetical protein